MSTVPDAEALLARARALAARAQPGEQVEVSLGRGVSSTVKAYDGDVESLTSAETGGAGVRVVRNGRQGFAHAGTLDADVLDDLLAEARDNATFGEVDPCNGLAEPDGVAAVEHDLWRDETVAFPRRAAIDAAIDLERRVRSADPRVVGVRAATFRDGWSVAAVATSTGIGAAWRATFCSCGVSALAEDGSETRIGASGDGARAPGDLDIDRVVAEAVERAVGLFGAGPVPSQRVRVVLEPRLAATVLGIVAGMLTGGRLVKGRTPFADRVGDVIASPLLTLVDDPTDPTSLGADTFDGEGLACRRNGLVRDGVFEGFVHNAYTGRRVGTPSTGSAVRGVRSAPGVGIHALHVDPGDGSLDDLLAGVDRGVLVSSLTGLHSGVNAVSGDFSVGVEGRMVRHGSLDQPVRGVTLASTLQRMLLDVSAVGADVERLPDGTSCPSIVIDDVALSGS